MKNTIAGVSLLIASVICTLIFTIGMLGYATGPEPINYRFPMQNTYALFAWCIAFAAGASFLASLFFFFLAAITRK